MLEEYLLLSLQNLPIAYFLSFYLDSDNRMISFIKTLLFYEILVNSCTYFLFYSFLLRFVGNIALFAGCIFLLYPKESTTKKIWALLFEIGGMLLSEVPTIGFHFGIYHHTQQELPTLALYTMQALIMTLIYYWIIRYFDVSLFQSRKEHILFGFCLVIQVALLYISATLFMDQPDQPAFVTVRGISYISILLVQSVLLYSLVRYSRHQQKEKTLWMLQKEYESQLNAYMNLNEDDQIRQLRHDLLNYWKERG